MSGRMLRRLSLITATLVVAAFSLSATSAYADPTTGSIAGQFTDAGTPVANARVGVYDLDFNFIQETLTDDGGAFSLVDVTPGEYKVSFDLPGFFTQYAHQKLSFDEADPITVVAGAQTTVNEEVIPHGSIAGRVTNADGSTFPAPFVLAQEVDRNFLVQTNGDADGNYSLPIVPAGTYIVSFRSGFDAPEQFANQKTTRDTADPITVGVGEQVTLDQMFLPVGAISGHLTDDGQPVADAQVSVQSQSGLFGSTQTDADGFYRIVLFPDVYTVQYSLQSGLTQYHNQKVLGDEADPVTVTAGPDVTVDEQLIDTGTVSDRLVDASGNPVSGAGVDLQNNQHFFQGRTDENGAYEVAAFPGVYRLSFATEHGQQWARGKSTAGEGDLITVTANETTVVDDTLAATGSITVTARDAATGQPFTDFCVFSSVGGSCAENGVVTFPAVLPGRHQVFVLPNDQSYMFVNVSPVVVRSGENTATVVDIVKWATITTSVVDASTGAPVQGACVEPVRPLTPTRLGGGALFCTDADGSLTLPFVEPGTNNLFAWAPFNSDYGHQWVGSTGGTGAQAKARLVTLKSGQSVTLPPIRLDRAGSISGTITDKVTGAPLRDAVAGLSSMSGGAGPTRSHTFTDSHGRYTLGNLGPYDWTLFFGRHGYASEFSGGVANRFLAKGVKVNVDQTTPHNVRLRKGTRLTGNVVGPNGEPAGLFGARITVINALTGDEMGVNDTAANSSYEVGVLGPQIVKLHYFANIIGAQYQGYYRDAGDLAHATPVVIPASGTKTLNITVRRPVP